jgi:hypothetical protein
MLYFQPKHEKKEIYIFGTVLDFFFISQYYCIYIHFIAWLEEKNLAAGAEKRRHQDPEQDGGPEKRKDDIKIQNKMADRRREKTTSRSRTRWRTGEDFGPVALFGILAVGWT